MVKAAPPPSPLPLSHLGTTLLKCDDFGELPRTVYEDGVVIQEDSDKNPMPLAMVIGPRVSM